MLHDVITSKTRIKLLSTFLASPSDMHHVRELVRLIDEEINAVRRELQLLEKKGIVKKEPRANRLYYYLDKTYEYFPDMVRIYTKMDGLGAAIIKNRVKLGKIKFVMMSGKFARKVKDAEDGVDLLVVGTVVIPELAVFVREEETKRGHEINYTVMTEEEFNFRKKRRDPFISSIIYGSRVMIIGDEEAMLA